MDICGLELKHETKGASRTTKKLLAAINLPLWLASFQATARDFTLLCICVYVHCSRLTKVV